jgi:predicted NBD/HSP70 family sugar kinase
MANLTPTQQFRGAAEILELVRMGRAHTRADLSSATGLSRSSISQRVDLLLSHGLIIAQGESTSTGGRPSSLLTFNGSVGAILCADLGASHAHLAVVNLGGEILAEREEEIDISDGPEPVLGRAADQFVEMIADLGPEAPAVRCLGVGLPGPVEFATGRPVSPPIMPGWDRFPVAHYFSERFACDVLVDNDVNLMAAGEAFHRRDENDLIFVKVGTGIGMGIVFGGEVQRGAQGCAGDIGHIETAGHGEVICVCGNRGCLEAVAGGGALAAQLRGEGFATPNARALVDLARHGVPEAVRVVREAGRELGAVLASVVNLLNPSSLVIGGEVADAGEHLLAGIRENVYRRSPPLATHTLEISRSTAGQRAGVIGATALCIEHLMSPDAIEQQMASNSGNHRG